MHRLALIALGALLALTGCGDSDDSDESPAAGLTPSTTTEAKSPPLGPTLRELGSGSPEVFCDRLTVRFLVENYMKPASLALRTCKREARRDLQFAPDEVEVDVVTREQGRANIALSVSGSPGRPYMALISDGNRWLIDGIAATKKELPGPRSPALTDRVSAEQLESFIFEQHASAVKVACSEVEHQDLGEWTCEMTHVFLPREPNKGYAVVTVAPDGAVSSEGFGAGSGITPCCIDLAPE
jgi:hypothetical protein